MEPSGCRPVATGGKCGNVENGSDSRKLLLWVAHHLLQKCHGTEGVSGSSPEEGLRELTRSRSSIGRAGQGLSAPQAQPRDSPTRDPIPETQAA
jgi:hypothetical protein